jgi:hypothetical protein
MRRRVAPQTDSQLELAVSFRLSNALRRLSQTEVMLRSSRGQVLLVLEMRRSSLRVSVFNRTQPAELISVPTAMIEFGEYLMPERRA